MTMPALPLLLVEDEPLVALSIGSALEDQGYAVTVAYTGGEACDLLAEQRFSLLVTDVRLGDGPDGWAVARKARENRADLPVIYITAHGAAEFAARSVTQSKLLQKPFGSHQLMAAVASAIGSGG